MPVQSNPGVQTVATLAWDGVTSRAYDIRKFVRFGWSFEVLVDIVADAVFNVEAAPVDDTDPCIPGAFAPVPEIASCTGVDTPAAQATITIPAGTLAGAVCSGTIPCKGNAFVRLTSASGDTDSVVAMLLRQGPKI